MKHNLIYVAAAFFLVAAVACDPDDNGNDVVGGNGTFQLAADTCSVPLEGGQVDVEYTFNDRPDGDFVVSLPEDSWLTFVQDNSDINTLTFFADENTERDRSMEVVVRYDYNDGFALDTVVFAQEGRDADVYIAATDCTGEYYADNSGIDYNQFYYAWVSTLGLWVTGSEGMNFTFFSDAELDLEPYEYNGSTYIRLASLPEGTYTYEATSNAPGTFNQDSFYGIAQGYDHSVREAIEGGTMTITNFDNDGDGEVDALRYEALVTCSDGLTYQLFFEGELHNFVYLD